MCAAVARVVELHQERWALQTVILRLARLHAAGPAKTNVFKPGALDALEAGHPDALGQHAKVGLDDLDRQLLLIRGQLAEWYADRIKRGDIWLVLRDMVGQRPGLKDRHGASALVKRVYQLAGGVLLARHSS